MKRAKPRRTEGGRKIEWIELFPSGIAVETAVGRPVLILKDATGDEVLPVWMEPLDAGVALYEMSKQTGATPHAVARNLLRSLELELATCTFSELNGHQQYVQIGFRGALSEKMEPLRVRASEAMSFCLQAKARFFSTSSYMARCRELDAQLGQLESGIENAASGTHPSELEISSKKHPYVM